MKTTPPPIDVWYEDCVEDGATVRRLIFEGVVGPGEPRLESWWRMPGNPHLGQPPVLDSFICGHVQWAAILGQDLAVHGPMSRGGLYNMGQLIEIRHSLSPERYKRAIAVMPDQVVSGRRPPGDPGLAIGALSGGLDSTFSVVRHRRILSKDVAFPLAGLVMVLGFDAPLARADRFDEMRRRSEPLARMLDLPLHPVITNSMSLGGQAWPQSAIPLFGSVLANFSASCAVGLVSAGAPYGTPRFGISHPPAFDALSSNEYFRVVSDGGGFGRTDKVEALLPFPAAVDGLRICWQGPDPARNCGCCEKCVMTRLNLLAAGLKDPACFDTPLKLSHIEALAMPSTGEIRDLFRTCLNELDQRNITGPEADLLRRRLSRVPPDSTIAAARRSLAAIRRVVPAPIWGAINRRLPAVLRIQGM